MKKLSALMAIVLLASVSMFTSCKKDSTGDVSPTINFVGGSGYTSSDATVAPGTPFMVGITALANTTSATKLNHFKVVRTFNNIPTTVIDSSFTATAAFTVGFETAAQATAGSERWTFTITDKDGQTAEISFVITTTVPAGDITTYTSKVLGSYQNATVGSSFASADGTVYLLADAKTNSAKIDWLYFYGATNHATIASPMDTDAASLFTGTNGLSNWATRNDTRFVQVDLGTATWVDITTSAQLANYASTAFSTSDNLLSVGEIIGFKTAAGKYGLIKVEAITGTQTGSITYSVKVQK